MATKIITVPDLGGATDVVVIEVLVKVGDEVKIDGSLLTLESDKATMDVPSSDAGIVTQVKVKVGDKVAAGSPIVVLETKSADLAGLPPQGEGGQRPEGGINHSPSKVNVAEGSVSPHPPSGHLPPAEEGLLRQSEPITTADEMAHAGPAVRQLARELGIDLTQIQGSGPKQRILKSDVTALVKSRLSQTAAATSGLPTAPVVDFTKFGPITTQPLSRIKKISGKNLHRNWLLVPHVTQFGEADVTILEDFRRSQKALSEQQGVKLTPLIFVMKAVVASLKLFPMFNASLDAQGENLILKQYYHIGVAVDTADGLVVPVIRDVDQKGLTELAHELSVVSEKARQKQLSPAEMQGGCFSISSLGGIGGTAFTPIVNVPEVAILGVSKLAYKPVYQEGVFVPRLMLPLSLSYDHRVIDGAEGARFIVHLSNMLSDIRNLLL